MLILDRVEGVAEVEPIGRVDDVIKEPAEVVEELPVTSGNVDDATVVLSRPLVEEGTEIETLEGPRELGEALEDGRAEDEFVGKTRVGSVAARRSGSCRSRAHRRDTMAVNGEEGKCISVLSTSLSLPQTPE